jgi:hypothetical protein
MEPLAIPASRVTPAVTFQPETRVLEFTGQSYPENAFEFYNPILEWAQKYLKESPQDPLAIALKLDYFNTSSSKCLLDLLELLEAEHQANAGRTLEIQWFYKQDDEDMEDSGRDFAEDLTVPFKMLTL